MHPTIYNLFCGKEVQAAGKSLSKKNLAADCLQIERPPFAEMTFIEDFIKSKQLSGPNGEPFLSSQEIIERWGNCQSGLFPKDQPIPNYMKKIVAVLSNPEEVKYILRWRCRPAGIWRAIQEPFSQRKKLILIFLIVNIIVNVRLSHIYY